MNDRFLGVTPHAQAAAASVPGADPLKVNRSEDLNRLNQLFGQVDFLRHKGHHDQARDVLANAVPVIANLDAIHAAARASYAEMCGRCKVEIPPSEPTEAENELGEIRAMLTAFHDNGGTVASMVGDVLRDSWSLAEIKNKLTPEFGEGLSVPEMVDQLIANFKDATARLQGPEPESDDGEGEGDAEHSADDATLDTPPKRKGRGKPASSSS